MGATGGARGDGITVRAVYRATRSVALPGGPRGSWGRRIPDRHAPGAGARGRRRETGKVPLPPRTRRTLTRAPDPPRTAEGRLAVVDVGAFSHSHRSAAAVASTAARMAEKFSITVFGATGFTGSRILRYLVGKLARGEDNGVTRE